MLLRIDVDYFRIFCHRDKIINNCDNFVKIFLVFNFCPGIVAGMDASTLDRELGLLVRRAVNSGLEPIIVLGFLTQNAVEVALHGRARAEAMMKQDMQSKIREAFKTPPPDPGDAPINPQGN